MRFILIFSLLLAGLVGCGGDNDKTVATVNGKKITNEQFDAFLKFKRVPVKDETRKARMLDQYLEREALAAVIEKKDLLDNAMIEAELNEFKKEMLISRYFEKYLDEQVTEQAVNNYYNTKAAEYEQKKAHVAHILIRLNMKMSEEERQVKLTTAQEAYSKVRAGEDFGKIAGAYSEDKISAKKGGDLDWVKEGTIDKRFSQTVFTMKEGDVSEPFETPFGFHIVKLLEAPQIVKQPLKGVAGDIRYQLRNQAKKAEMDRLLAEVKIKK
ncbi:MAG: peptidylprolyl isomerase [Proteobacteria bacterium]|nr:peptidylprolyl isomerase [Pseudomonadota bacterium]MBU1638860.1 peptidylprolyl isomerase [Pseudomonadota bacterium]